MPTLAEVMSLETLPAGWKAAHQVQVSEAQIERAVRLLYNLDGHPRHLHRYMMEEAVVSTDFPNLLGLVLDRDLMARYKTEPLDFWGYTRRLRASNFNAQDILRLDGLNNPLPLVGENGEYLVGYVGDTKVTYRVYKRGRQFDIKWEAIVNDALGAFSDIAERMAESAINTDSFQVTSLIAAATGPNPALFGAPIVAPDGANVTNVGVLPLTGANLQTTLGLMARQTSPITGLPLGIRGLHLVVAPELEDTAWSIVTSSFVQYVDVQGGAGAVIQPFPTENPMKRRGIQVHVNEWLPQVDLANADTTWYLFADPARYAAIGYGYLTGHEAPEVCMKNSNKVTLQGQAISPFAGDFESDNIFYRVRHVCGGCGMIEPRACYAQVGP